MFSSILFSALTAGACPFFSEFLPDPVDTADALGEFLEVRLGENFSDTLFISFEGKPEVSFSALRGERLLLHRDTLTCQNKENLDCRLLQFPALPNSRESVWALRQGDCKDSAYLPVPRPGKSLQRSSADYSSWELSESTPGRGNPLFESDALDCALVFERTLFDGKNFEVFLSLSGCDSAIVSYRASALDWSNVKHSGEKLLKKSGSILLSSSGVAMDFFAEVPPDENDLNNRVEVLLATKTHSPITWSEVHHCPKEGDNEWVEIYNGLPRALSLQGLSLCARGKIFLENKDSIGAFESVLLTKDTASLREELGFNDVKIFKAALGALKNAADTLALCLYGDTLDVVRWDKSFQKVCPEGFNPLTAKQENTPGFQNRRVVKEPTSAPFLAEVDSRIASKKHRKNPRFKISGNTSVRISLLSEKGSLRWETSGKFSENIWYAVPLAEEAPGLYLLKFRAGNYEKTIGVVLRP